jgi:hypothetical protein
MVLAPELGDDLQRLVEALGALAGRAEVEAVRLVLRLVPAGAHSEDQPAVADVVDRGGHLRHQRGVPVRVAGHEDADADAARLRGERRQRRPAFEVRAVRVGEDRHEVVVQVGGVEAEALRLAPRREQVVPARVVRRLDAETHAAAAPVGGRRVRMNR